MKTKLTQIPERQSLRCSGHVIQLGSKGELSTLECSCGRLLAVGDSSLNPGVFTPGLELASRHIQTSQPFKSAA